MGRLVSGKWPTEAVRWAKQRWCQEDTQKRPDRSVGALRWPGQAGRPDMPAGQGERYVGGLTPARTA